MPLGSRSRRTSPRHRAPAGDALPGGERLGGRAPAPAPARPPVRRRTLRARGCNKGKWLRGGEGCGAGDGLPACARLLPLSRGGTGAGPGAAFYVCAASVGPVPQVLAPAPAGPFGCSRQLRAQPRERCGSGAGAHPPFPADTCSLRGDPHALHPLPLLASRWQRLAVAPVGAERRADPLCAGLMGCGRLPLLRGASGEPPWLFLSGS